MFVRVDAKQAGPTALGILVPPGMRTLVIVRPRALTWDLLPARWDGVASHAPQFGTFGRDEAAGVARRLIPALEAAGALGPSPVQTFGTDGRLQIWLRVDEIVWIACRREPGQPYEPMTFASAEEADHAAESLVKMICPAPDTRQEYYFNTQKFSEFSSAH